MFATVHPRAPGPSWCLAPPTATKPSCLSGAPGCRSSPSPSAATLPSRVPLNCPSHLRNLKLLPTATPPQQTPWLLQTASSMDAVSLLPYSATPSSLSLSTPPSKKTTFQVGADSATQAAIDTCIDGPEGQALMQRDVQLVADRGVAKSCTVAVNKRQRCIRDGGRWCVRCISTGGGLGCRMYVEVWILSLIFFIHWPGCSRFVWVPGQSKGRCGRHLVEGAGVILCGGLAPILLFLVRTACYALPRRSSSHCPSLYALPMLLLPFACPTHYSACSTQV